MAESIISSVAVRIGNLLVEEAKFLYQVEGQVLEIETELLRMQCFLEDFDSIRDKNKRVSNWISEIRQLAYRVEDVLEVFVVEVASRRSNQGFIKRLVAIFTKGVTIHKVGSEIETIKIKITNLTTRLQTYGIRDVTQAEGSSSANGKRLQLRRTYSHVIEQDFVGFEEDIRKLVVALLDNDKYFRAISICGMGGLGKTTLAKKIYQHADVRRHFDAFAWVCISQQWNKQDVLQGMLANLKKENKGVFREMGDGDLVKEIFEIQKSKKCLVVLDDIWSTDLWDNIRSAFPDVYNGSKILLTSRTKLVATHIDPFGLVHEPSLLDDEKSWELFQKKALPRADNADSTMDEKKKIGREMLKQCRGLPLAIVVLGGILLRKQSLNEWQGVHRNVDMYIRREKRRGEQEDGRGIEDVLALSYYELPYWLKPCFLYLSLFPEDYEIEIDKLYQLWMAEGFISPEEGRGEEETMLDIGEYYLGELAERCMVLVQIDDGYPTLSSSRYKSCRLHDLMRDICLSKVKEENFLKVMDCHSRNIGQQHRSSSSSSPLLVTSSNHNNNIHRLAIYLDEHVDSNVFLNLKNDIRSILFFYGYVCHSFMWEQVVSHVAKICTSVRVLDLDSMRGPDSRFGVVPKVIGNLIHLRYLSFRECETLHELPSSIGNLRYLLTLDLRVSGGLMVPNVLWKLQQLVNLYLPRLLRVTKGKLRLEGLNNLEILENFCCDFCCVEDLYKLTKLQKLINLLTFKDTCHVLQSLVDYLTQGGLCLQHSSVRIYRYEDCCHCLPLLRKLFFECHHHLALYIKGHICKIFEDQGGSYSNLTSLELNRSGLEEDQMAFLGKLPNLIELTLVDNAFEGSELVCSAHGFPRLRILNLFGLYMIEEWRVDEGAMRSLSSIYIMNCPKLKMLPDGLRFITTLKELKIGNMPHAFRKRLQFRYGKEGEDFEKIRHIPSISIMNY